jgi:hypothetical protein
MAFQYAEKHIRSVQLDAGSRQCYSVENFPQRCVLSKLVIVQVNTPAHEGDVAAPVTNFRVDVFNARFGCRSGGSVSSGGEADPESESYSGHPSLYRVCDTLHSDGAGEIRQFWGSDGPTFVNMDVPNAPTRTGKILYLEFDRDPEPGVEGLATYDIAIGFVIDVP